MLAWTADFDEQRLSQVIARDVALLGEIGAQSVISDARRAADEALREGVGCCGCGCALDAQHGASFGCRKALLRLALIPGEPHIDRVHAG